MLCKLLPFYNAEQISNAKVYLSRMATNTPTNYCYYFIRWKSVPLTHAYKRQYIWLHLK